MKTRSSLALLAFAATGFFSVPALSLAASAAPTSEDRAAALRERMEATAAELKLTPEQKEKLTPLIKAEMEKVAALRADQGLKPREKLSRLKAIRDEYNPQVKAILTPEQYTQWEKKRAEARDELRERVKERRGQK
ncbi:MAG: hypothetical protein NTV51_29140 [Verrucomicrobia bacterium]|nr:hypothetical protein [Verrucomicrobiota bacterium]